MYIKPTLSTECSVFVDQDEGAVLDMRVMICARCAKVLNRAEEGSELTGGISVQVGWLVQEGFDVARL